MMKTTVCWTPQGMDHEHSMICACVLLRCRRRSAMSCHHVYAVDVSSELL